MDTPRTNPVIHTRAGLTVRELVLSVAMSSAVMLAAFSLVNAYAYASSEIQDLRPLRTEAVAVHAYVQNWMRRASDIIAVTSVADQLTVTEAGIRVFP